LSPSAVLFEGLLDSSLKFAKEPGCVDPHCAPATQLKPVGATGIGLLTAAGKRLFLDQSDARVFLITFAVFVGVNRRVFVIVPDAECAAEFFG